MPIQRVTINSYDPNTIVLEQAFFLAVADGAVGLCDVVNFRTDSTGDGKKVEAPATDNLSAFAGVCVKAAADTKVVKLQSMGYCPTGAEVIGHADLSCGDKLVSSNAVDHFVYSAAGDGLPAFAIFMGAAYTNVTTTATKPVFLYGIS